MFDKCSKYCAQMTHVFTYIPDIIGGSMIHLQLGDIEIVCDIWPFFTVIDINGWDHYVPC